MAIPYNPTISELCRTALRRAGQPAPSNGQIGEAISQQFQEVKNDIKLVAGTHPLLLANEVTVTIAGVQSYSQPSKANVVKSVLLYDGPSSWRGTLTAGNTTSLGFPSAIDSVVSSTDMVGKTVFTLSGTGSLQWAYIYNYTSATALVSPTLATAASTDTVIQVCNYKEELYDSSKQVINYLNYNFGVDRPIVGAMQGETFWLNCPPDKIYPLLWTYYKDIDQMDETDTDGLWTKILREWRSVFIEGVTAKSMVLYDDTRQYDHMRVYQFMLNQLKSEALTIEQTVPYDPAFY